MYDFLLKPLSSTAGIGPALERRLAARGICCFGDLLLHLPKHYVDDRQAVPIRALVSGHSQRTQGKVVQREARGVGRRKQVIILLEDGAGGRLQLSFFHSPFLLRDARLQIGQRISVRGEVKQWQGRLQMAHPEWVPQAAFVPGWRPVYAALAGLNARRVSSLIERLLAMMPVGAASPLDTALSALPGLRRALEILHQPGHEGPNGQALGQARERLLLEELLVYLHLMREKRRRAQVPAPALTRTSLAAALLNSLPYPLTPAQQQAWREIRSDLASGQRMHRLLQGDVGSGKTWVAALAMLAAVDSGLQAALMAPTEVLAGQHVATLRDLFKPLGLDVCYLAGGMRAGDKKRIAAGLAKGDIGMVVGTHALIAEGVRFARLGLAVVDEQHRFGVRQRWELAERGEAVHLLAMTATPIPRSLALALYGDMDLSLMQGMPPGRRPVKTTLIPHHKRRQLADGMRRILDGGGRIYWIVPRIDEENDGVSVSQRADALKRHFPEAAVAALHGRMKSGEKQAVLEAFTRGDCRVLVSTTVVEVGVNVPEARLMIIEHADRYGLAQLHQLRGRVGRSSEQGYCVLLPDKGAPAAALARLKHMCATHDGLELAELDLALRGAGDALGVMQSGEAGFKLLNLVEDIALIRAWHDKLPAFRPSERMLSFWRPVAASID